MTVNDLLHDFILQLLRRGFTVPQVAEALAEQKVKLMQADEYLSAAKEWHIFGGGESDAVSHIRRSGR